MLMQTEVEDLVVVTCVVVERRGRQYDTEGWCRLCRILCHNSHWRYIDITILSWYYIIYKVLVCLLDVSVTRDVHGGGSEHTMHVLQSLQVMSLLVSQVC